MNKNQSGSGNLLWKFFASVNLTIVTLISIATASIIGTLIPQNGQPDFYFHKYGEVLYKIFSAFTIFDMYHSWWFRLLVLTLVINIIVCSIDKISATWKILFPGFYLSTTLNLPLGIRALNHKAQHVSGLRLNLLFFPYQNN